MPYLSGIVAWSHKSLAFIHELFLMKNVLMQKLNQDMEKIPNKISTGQITNKKISYQRHN